MTACVVLCLQSLADVARDEAERRKLLDQQGIEAKVIEVDAGQKGNLTISTDSPPAARKDSQKKPARSDGRTSVRSFRNALQKLDRAIRQNQERLESRRARLRSGRWEISKSGRASSSNAEKSQSRLQEEIEDLEMKLNQLRQERSEVYQEGRKAGFLPGELDGKGIVP
jgi:chromosome segregation ATPase